VVFTEADYRLMRSLGSTEGGKVLCQYMEQMAESDVRNMLNGDPNNAAVMAAGQAGAKCVALVISLLRGDIQDILDQHNVEVKDE
jgi:hypothetical protein